MYLSTWCKNYVLFLYLMCRWLLSSPKVRKSEIKGSSFRRFVSPKVRKSDNDIDSFLF